MSFLKALYSSMADDSNPFALHESVFRGHVRKVSALLRTQDVEKKDKHGEFFFIIRSLNTIGAPTL